jgi:hypothetical protein
MSPGCPCGLILRLLGLAHGWKLTGIRGIPQTLVREFIRPAVHAVPSSMARRLGPCCIALSAEPDTTINSQWTETATGLEISVVITDREHHDTAMDLLVCVGQALWEKLSDAELRAYWLLLSEEIGAGITGEIDEEALDEKRSLLASRSHANNPKRLARYGRASFAGTAAEYVHCLWHDVTTRTGPGYLPAPHLRRRLDLLARSFPPDRGYHLFPTSRS